jgi:hypothetical protein
MATASRARTPAQMFALVFGIVYLAVGLLGFAVTGFDDFFADTREVLIIFPVNPAHNIVHILLGAVWLGAARAHASAKGANTGIGAAYLLVFVLGLFGALTWLNIDAGFNADQVLHLVSGAASLYFGTAGATASRTATA